MQTNIPRIDPDRQAPRPPVSRARRRPGSTRFAEALEPEPDGRPARPDAPAAAEREAVPPSGEEPGTRLDVVG